jgi:IS5 family transposase
MLSKKKMSSLELFQLRLTNLCSHSHPLYKLADQIDWSVFEAAFGPTYCEDNGRAAKPIRLLVGLHYLKHAFNEGDETVVAHWVENPYWQYFCGMEHFTHEFPCHPTLLVKWRHRVGADKLETMLAETVACALREKILNEAELSAVTVDTTVQEKNIAFPTDARLYQKCRVRLIAIAKQQGIQPHQTFDKDAKVALLEQHRFATAGKYKKAAKMSQRLKTFLGRVVRDIERKADPLHVDLWQMIDQANRLLAQQRNSKNKIYSLHEPDVECIAKGKAHKKYEFGCKVGVVTTMEGSWAVGAEAFHGNPYDGHTLDKSLAAAERITGVKPRIACCDQGYRGHNYTGETLIHVTARRGKTMLSKLLFRRRPAVEPLIGHLKSDNRMGRCYLKGKNGDRINALLAAAGYNLRKLLRAFFFSIPEWLQKAILGEYPGMISAGITV